MPINSESLNRKLYDLLTVRGYNPKPLDTEGKVTPVPEEAAVMKFDFIKDDKNYGQVWISIDGSKTLQVYYGDAVADSSSDKTDDASYDNTWTGLIRHLKNWAQRRQLGFELKNENHLAPDMARRSHTAKKEKISEESLPKIHRSVETSKTKGVSEGSLPGQAAWKKEMLDKGAVKFWRDQHGGGTVDRIIAKDKDGNIVGAFNRKGVAEGWKDVVAGGVLALGSLGAGAQTMPNINVQQVELANKYYNVLVQRAKEDGKQLDTRTLNLIKAKAHDAAAQKFQQTQPQQQNNFPSQGSERRVSKDIGQFESQGVAEMDNRTLSGDRKEQRANSPEAIAQREKEQQANLKKVSPEMRKKLRLPDPDKEDMAEGSDYTPPKLGTVKANLMLSQKPTVQVKVFKHNTLRGDSYWVTKEVRTFKTMDQAQAYVDRINKQGMAEAKGKLTYTPKPMEYGVFPDNKNEFVKTFLSKELALDHVKKFGGKLIVLDQQGRRMKLDMAEGQETMKQVSEGYYPMGKQGSYSDAVPTTKIIIQHSRKIEEGEQRYRNIAKIFVENTQGERFAVPTIKPGIARVYARHIAEGGTPYDERGKHITSLVEEYSKMAGFVRATKGKQFNESAQQLVNEGINHYQSLRESLRKMTGHRGYMAYFESYTPTLVEDGEEHPNLNELFVQETLDPRIESVMPILSKLHKKVSEMREVGALAEWADSLTEMDDAPVEESGLQAYLGNKKYGKEGMDALRKAGREHAGKEKMAKIRAKYDNLDEELEEDLDANQIRAGQLGPTEKVGPEGAVGKLVGANESVEQGMAEGSSGRIPKLPRRHFYDTYAGQGIAYTDNTHWWKIVDGQVVDFTNNYEDTRDWKREFVAKQKSQQSMAEGLNEMDSEGYKGSRDDADELGNKKEGTGKMVKPDEVTKDAKEKLEKSMDKAHKKEVKEGQEDLAAILRIIKK